MSTENSFKNNLYEAAEKKVVLINATVMPMILDNYRSIHASLQGLINLFESKKLVLPDPYKQETRLADITIPSTDEFHDSEGPTVFGIRLSEYEQSLDFLCHYGLFTVEALSPDRIKTLLAFNSFIDWNSLTHFSAHANNRFFCSIVNSIKNSGDSMAIGLLNNMVSVIVKKMNEINAELKKLSDIQKELYKIEVRKNVIDNPAFTKKYETLTDRDAYESIKKEFPHAMDKKKFYTKLIEEIIKEDFSPNKEVFRDALLEIFHIEEKKEKIIEEKVNTRAMILEVVKIMYSFSSSFGSIYKKIEENHELYQAEKKSGWDKFLTGLRMAFGLKPKPIEYKIKTLDMISNTEKTEIINYYVFMDDLHKGMKIYASLGGINATTLKKLEGEDEEDILIFVQKRLTAVQNIFGIFVGFDNFFKSSVHQANRSKVKGLKMDLDVLKNNLLKANRNKADYIATVTFEKQMNKLGVIDE